MIYKKPIAEIIEFDDADVITRSGGHHWDCWWFSSSFCKKLGWRFVIDSDYFNNENNAPGPYKDGFENL